MKSGAGEYKWQYGYSKMTRTTDGVTGDSPRTYTIWGTFWGTEEPQSGSQENEFGATRPRETGVIRLRNLLHQVKAEDRLIGGYYGTTYIIDGVRINWANNETICDVHSLEVY